MAVLTLAVSPMRMGLVKGACGRKCRFPFLILYRQTSLETQPSPTHNNQAQWLERLEFLSN
ncbi:MAG: hypothetical protein P4L10_13770 [Acidobacteriaceae bacterium]|jgi:hypothetical protein|nr:hypothetical protein [Acidobacteriaceae bacterium]